jgi:hypothetical protein
MVESREPYRVSQRGKNMKTGILLTTIMLVSGVAGSDVIINEIMYNPSSALGPDDDFEWVEIYNTGASAVDITGWSLTDNYTTITVLGAVSIPSEGYMVFARSEIEFVAHYGSSPPLIPWEGTWGGLANGGDELTLSDGAATIDFIDWDDTEEWGSDYGDENTYPDHDGDGATLERIDPAGTTNDPANWESSTDEASGIPDVDWPGHDESHGTPGEENSVSGSGAFEAGTWAGIKAVFL